MRIIEQSRAPNPRRVRIFLAEKGIGDVSFEQLDIMKHEHQGEQYRALNPLAQVPTLVLDDGTAISESVAICRYFEETRSEPALFGTGAKGRALVEMWNRRVELGLYQHVANCFRHGHPAMAPLEVPQIAQLSEVSRTRALEILPVFDRRLAESRYLAGDAYSIADITLLVTLDFMKPARLQRPDGLAGLERWYAEVAARPSAKA